MARHRRFSGVIGLICLTTLGWAITPAHLAAADDAAALAWPPITQLNQQWTRWWWMGSAVDQANITHVLEQYHDAGIGGVEICPIYGAYGYESRYIDFLSPKWMDMLAWSGSETQRLGMGMDMTTGTGWPMGGPNVSVDDASSTDSTERFEVAGGSTFDHTFTNPARPNGNGIPAGPTAAEAQRNISPLTSGIPVSSAPPRIATVMAYSSDGQKIDLTSQVKGVNLNWTAPAGSWVIYAVVQHGPAMKVKRPAPGGEGNVNDPFSVQSMDDFLAQFNKAFASYKGVMPQAQFHDSYEYVGDWTGDLFDKFKALRGYDLRDQLPAFFGDGPADQTVRVINDYRQTMADLHMAYVQRWIDWTHSHNMLAREQAHGAPANTLDLYGLADMPETETFGSADEAASDGNFPMNKFASSAAHVVGRQIASSESFTWLGQHFQISLADVKPVADYLLLSGINHMLFHGMAYSPQDVPWPGWLFYASVDFNPNGGLWHDMPAYTAYVARCQSILQSGKPSNDVLLYFPVNDIWQTPVTRSPLIPFVIGGQWMRGTPFYNTAIALQARGYGVDYISDTQLTGVKFENGALTTGGAMYHAIVVPPCKLMPPQTMETLVNLAKLGATVVFQNNLPSDVPGLYQLDFRRAELIQACSQIQVPSPDTNGAPQGTPLGNGFIWVGKNLNAMLDVAGVQREPKLDVGLQFIRRTYEHGYHYFLANRGGRPFDGWITLSVPAKAVEILDPMHPDRTGLAALRHDASGRVQIYLQLQPLESCLLRTFGDQTPAGPAWTYWQQSGEATTLAGTWKIHFIDGGPVLPADITTEHLASWTEIGDTQARRFAGTGVYTLTFNAPAQGSASDWLLDIGKVAESARVRINGVDAGTLFSAPFQVHVGSLIHPGENTLELEVTNLASNRIRDLDIRGVKWRIFRDINFVSPGAYGAFNAAVWPVRDSGLIGPVRLVPLSGLDTGSVK
jgi:hypothetical protein